MARIPWWLLFGVVAIPACRSAAEVLLDLPEPAPKPTAEVAQPGTQVQVPDREPAREPAPIESVPAESALAILPRHASGQVDWGVALATDVVRPQETLPGAEREDTRATFGYDFFFGDVETAFPHSTHTEWISCQSCHPAIYRTRGGGKTTMAMIQNGESCGVCHGTVAFAADACERCHPALQLPPDRIEPSLKNDLVLPRDSVATLGASQFPPSIFPHWVHRIRYACAACHSEPFGMVAGGTPISMEGMQRGETCGACHDGTAAFGVMECDRCHREPPPPVTASARDPDSDD